MKKTILLTSLLASVATMAAGTTGSVEAYNKNETVYENGAEFNTSFRETKTTTGVKTEVKVKDTGLSFGADVKVKDYTIFADASTLDKVLGNVKSNSSVWAKYDLPEMNNINSYVKAKYETKGKINVEGDLSYKLAEKLSAGLNSKTEFDLSGALTPDKVKSTHKAYLKGEYDKVKDIYAELGVEHTYEEVVSAKNVFLNAKASYMPMKDLTLSGKIDFKHTLNGDMSDDSLLFNEFNLVPDANVKLEGMYRHSYLLGVKYTGVKDTELKLDSFIEHNRVSEEEAVLNFGFKPEVKYTGVPNLVLSSKNVFGGSTLYNFVENEKDTVGYIKLNANAEYTYNVTDKFTVKPSLDLTSEFLTNAELTEAALAITPKLMAEYKPAESLTISGDLAPVFNFNNDSLTFGYVNTTVKSSVNVKYTW